jgi:uncharacterized protein (TIGR00255 family)
MRQPESVSLAKTTGAESGAPETAPSHSTVSKSRSSLRSMTGYAEARAEEGCWNLRISVRSVNHRFLDLHLRVPEGFETLEPHMRRIVRERVRRGHLDVTLRYELTGPASVGINQEVAAAYLQAINLLRHQFSIQTEPDLAPILRLPGVIRATVASDDQEIARLEAVVTRCLLEALNHLDRMREREAASLQREMSEHLSRITTLAARVEVLAESARPAFARRLESRIKELLGERQIEPSRLAQEAAIAAERSDVAEELARLKSHVQQFDSMLAGAPDAGKKLDFLLQEMQRETNTLLSKTPGIEAEGLEITQLGIEIKSEIEKLREQAQNIE